ncbi:MAG: AAA family ATPase [Gaiella sp.]
MSLSPFLIRASELLGRPDPGPTPYLVAGLIAEESLTAAAGRWKTAKTYVLLYVAMSIVAGRQVFGERDVKQGAVVYVCEEAGEKAMHRRLAALARGHGIDADELGDLHLAPNRRVKLDDPGWQHELLAVGKDLKPRAFIFDPLTRMRDASRDENETRGMAPLVEFMRDLRNETSAAVVFVHHTGHTGEHMRGASDLESAWDDRLWFRKDESTVSITNEHRDDEPSAPIALTMKYNPDNRAMRLQPTLLPLAERIVEHLREHGPMGAEKLAKGIETRRSDVDRTLTQLETAGTTRRAPSQKRDDTGRHNPAKVWHLSEQAVLRVVPEPGRHGTTRLAEASSSPCRPVPLGTDDADETPRRPDRTSDE